jgi:site-specific DNA recombinase
MRTALYVRVSTDLQAKEGFSIASQTQRLNDFARSQGWNIVETFIDDGYSAKDLNRPQIQKMMQGIKDRQFDVILVYKLDRLVRSVSDLHEILQLLDKYNCKFKSATEMFETTTAMGRFFITLVAAMASWEREQISERVLLNMKKKHAEGQRNGGRTPYGYDYSDGELVINKEEAKWVKYIFDESEIKGAKAIAIALNKNGLRTKQDSLWSATTITLLLTNPVYYGMLRWNYMSKGKRTYDEELIPGTHEPIITKEQFDRVAEIRKNRAINRGKGHVAYPFSGVLKCKRCGGKLTGSSRKYKNGQVYRFYKCITNRDAGMCDMPSFGEEKIDNQFMKNLDPEQIDFKVPETETIDKKEIEKELKNIKARMKRIDDIYIAGGKTIKWYKEEMDKEQKREAELLQSLNAQTNHITPEELKGLLNFIKENWSLFDYEQRKKTIQDFFEFIEVEHTDSLKITDYALK